MSAAVLREAVALMRERAEAATEVWGATRWRAHHAEKPYARGVHTSDLDRHTVSTDDEHGSILLSSSWDETQIVDHAASWHPAVALAVADLLEDIATGLDLGLLNIALEPFAVRLARAYLGADR